MIVVCCCWLSPPEQLFPLPLYPLLLPLCFNAFIPPHPFILPLVRLCLYLPLCLHVRLI